MIDSRTTRLVLTLAVFMGSGGCGSIATLEEPGTDASLNSGDAGIGFDGGGAGADAATDAGPVLPDADLGTPLTLSQNTDPTKLDHPLDSFGCHDSINVPRWITGENGYIRRYHLAEAGVSTPFTINSVLLGVNQAVAGDGSGSQGATLKIYTLNGVLKNSNLTLVASEPVNVPDQADTFTTFPINVTVPGNSVFVVEIFVPDGTAANNTLKVAFNNYGESAPTYARMPGCGAKTQEIIDIDTLDQDIPPEYWPWFASFHLVMTVNGTY